eukprot:14381_1
MVNIFYITFLLTTLSIVCNSSLIFGFETVYTNISSYNASSSTIIMTLFWSGTQHQCAILHPNQQKTKYLCNTSNVDTYQCYTNSTNHNMLQIDNLQHDYNIGINKIIIQNENTTTFFQDEKLLNYKQHLQIQFTPNNSYIHNITETSKCVPENILNENQQICVFQSSNEFLDGEFEYLFWNSTINGAVYYNIHNNYYIYPYIHNNVYYWQISDTLNEPCLELCSYCIAGTHLGIDYIFDISNCETWVTDISDPFGASWKNDLYMMVKDCNYAALLFGFKVTTTTPEIYNSNPVIVVTLNWNYKRFQCAIEPTQPNTFYFCNTLLTSTLIAAYQCDENYSVFSDDIHIQYGIQIDTIDEKVALSIDQILIKEIFHGDVINMYNIDYFNTSDILFIGDNQYNIIIFDNDTIHTNSSVNYHPMESSECYPIGYHNYILDKVCVSGARITYLNGIYKYLFWNSELNGAVYYQEHHNWYLYPRILRVDSAGRLRYMWQIGKVFSNDIAKALCTEKIALPNINGFRHVFNISNCAEPYTFVVTDEQWVIDPYLTIEQCVVNTANEIIFGIIEPLTDKSRNRISSNTSKLILTLFWEGLRYQCEINPQLAELRYFCSSLSTLTTKCDTTLFRNSVNYKYGMQIDIDGNDEVLIDKIYVTNIKGNVIQNIYEINDFCFNSSLICIDLLIVDNVKPYNLIVFDNNLDVYSGTVMEQISPAQCTAVETVTLVDETLIITLSVIGSALCLIVIAAIIYIIYLRKTRYKHNQVIRNGLVVIIAIGDYDNVFKDLPVGIDIKNLKSLFRILNYNVIPSEKKIHWKEDEIIEYFDKVVGNELFDENTNELKYDGLIVFISCHGMEGKIVTSDHRTIDKNVIHRIVSKNKKARMIPRLFFFDSCEGGKECEKIIKPATVSVNKYLVPDDELEQKDFNEQNKGINDDMEQKQYAEFEWPRGSQNPDFKLVEIHAANPGYQAKLHKETGSYLIYGFTYKMKINILKKQGRTLQEILEETQDELHSKNKQLIKSTFFNHTAYVRFEEKKVDTMDLNDENQQMNEKELSPKGYQIVETKEDDL